MVENADEQLQFVLGKLRQSQIRSDRQSREISRAKAKGRRVLGNEGSILKHKDLVNITSMDERKLWEGGMRGGGE